MHSIQDLRERRRAQRFQVALRVELTEGTAVTRNFSTSGVFFEATRTFAVGESICFIIVLEHIDPGHTWRLQCCGRVVRVEPYSHSVGVAVGITGYRLEARTEGEEWQGSSKEAHAPLK
jgi:Tfp pilus assembly protein PilZ